MGFKVAHYNPSTRSVIMDKETRNVIFGSMKLVAKALKANNPEVSGIANAEFVACIEALKIQLLTH